MAAVFPARLGILPAYPEAGHAEGPAFKFFRLFRAGKAVAVRVNPELPLGKKVVRDGLAAPGNSQGVVGSRASRDEVAVAGRGQEGRQPGENGKMAQFSPQCGVLEKDVLVIAADNVQLVDAEVLQHEVGFFLHPQQDLFFGERDVQARSQEACLDVQRISSRLAGGVPVGGEGRIQPSGEADEGGVVHRVLGIVNDLFGCQRDGMELVRVPFDECLREVFQIPEQGEAYRSVDPEFAADAHHLKDEQALQASPLAGESTQARQACSSSSAQTSRRSSSV